MRIRLLLPATLRRLLFLFRTLEIIVRKGLLPLESIDHQLHILNTCGLPNRFNHVFFLLTYLYQAANMRTTTFNNAVTQWITNSRHTSANM
jgi:hypothetical protein